MNNCKACNQPIEGDEFAKFCSEKCTKEYDETMRKVNRFKIRDDNPPDFEFSCVLKRRGQFFISNTSLENIYNNTSRKVQFEMLLYSQDLMVVRLDSEMSVIKKSIL